MHGPLCWDAFPSSIPVRTYLYTNLMSPRLTYLQALTLRSFYQRRAQFTTFMSSSNNAITMARYIRLMSLCICDMVLTVPLASYIMYIGSHGIRLSPWISWDDTHFDWNRVEVVPALFWRSVQGYEITVELTRWLAVFCAFFFFAMFGFASEAKNHYRLAFWWCAKRVGYQSKTTPPKFTLPSYVSRSILPIGLSFYSDGTVPPSPRALGRLRNQSVFTPSLLRFRSAKARPSPPQTNIPTIRTTRPILPKWRVPTALKQRSTL